MDDSARKDAQDVRAWWTLGIVVLLVLLAYLGLSAGFAQSGRRRQPDPRADSSRSSAPAAEAQPLAREDLRDLGELGVLPGLLDDFTTTQDCDFDDALSTCQ